MRTKKIPFDLERWESGDFVKVETRDGIEVKELYYFKTTDSPFPIRAVTGVTLNSFTTDGFFNYDKEEHDRDLLLVVEDKEIDSLTDEKRQEVADKLSEIVNTISNLINSL